MPACCKRSSEYPEGPREPEGSRQNAVSSAAVVQPATGVRHVVRVHCQPAQCHPACTKSSMGRLILSAATFPF